MISKKIIEGIVNVLYCIFIIKVFNSWNIIMSTSNMIKLVGYKVVERKDYIYIFNDHQVQVPNMKLDLIITIGMRGPDQFRHKIKSTR